MTSQPTGVNPGEPPNTGATGLAAGALCPDCGLGELFAFTDEQTGETEFVCLECVSYATDPDVDPEG